MPPSETQFRSAAQCFQERLKELVKSKGLSIKAVAQATGIDYDKFRRWSSRGINRPDSRSWEELSKVAVYFDVRRPVYLWVSHEAAREIETFRANGDWQVYCGHPDLELDKVVEFGERLRCGESAEEIRRSVRWRRPKKKVSVDHLAMARNAAFRVEDVCVWLPEKSARSLVDEVDALIWKHRSRQTEKMRGSQDSSSEL